MSNTTTNHQRAHELLYEIACGAHQAANLSKFATATTHDVAALDAYCAAMETMTARIGWLAELAAAELGEEIGIRGTQAQAWMAPNLPQNLRSGA